jgi:ubiquinone/menaquinone biosynthesis C-methylase UbiE
MNDVNKQADGVTLWNDIHSDSSWLSDGPFPSANAQAFVRYHVPLTPAPQNVSLLDLGCGTGAATVFFAKMGYRLNGLDASPVALGKARRRAEENGVKIAFDEGDFRALPYADGQFDAVFSESVLYYGVKDDFEKGVDEVFRVLKPGGLARIYTKTDRDMWVTQGEPLGDNVFKVVGDAWERGLPIYCASLEQIRSAFSKFSDLQIGIKEFNYVSLQDIHSFWVITCRKP